MADRTVTVTLAANVAPYVGPMTAAAASTKAVSTAATGMGQATAKAGTQGATGMQKFANAATPAGVSMSAVTTGGLAMGAAIGFGVKKFMDFDAQMSSVQAATGATGKELESLRGAAIKMGADTKFGATDAAEGIESLSKAGIESKDILGGGLKGALDLAAAGEIEVGEAADLAATAMTQFNLTGGDVPHVADLMAAAAGKAQGTVGDMAMAFKQSGLVASQMGLSIEQTTGTLAAFASAGLVGSDAGTSFRTMLLRLANPSGEAKDIMNQLGVAAYDAQGNFVGMSNLAGQLKDKLGGLAPAQRDAALATIFGSDAIRAANILYQQGAAGIDDWTTKVDDAGFAADQAAARTDNLRGDVERLMGSLESLAIGSSDTADSGLRDLTQGLDAVISSIDDVNEASKGWTEGDGLIATIQQSIPGLGAMKQGAESLGSAMESLGLKTADATELTAEQQATQDRNTQASYLARDASGEFAEQTKATQDAVDLQVDALEDLRDEYFKTMNAALGVRDAQVGWEQALDDLTTSIEDNGTTLDINTQKGRDNRTALDNIASAALSVMDQMYETGASQDEVNRTSDGMRTSLFNAARQFGLSEDAAWAYVDQVLKVPPTATTTVAFSDTAARTKIRAFISSLGGIPSSIPVSIRATGSGGVGGPMSAFAGSGNRVFPLPGGKSAYRVTQGLHPVNAIDYGAPSGTPVFASFSGYLITGNLGNRSYGKYYRLSGAGQRPILGAHLSAFSRNAGPIAKGAQIGWTGTTGNSTGPHLHLENFHTGGWTRGGPINTLRGEYIVNPAASASNRGLLEAINAGRDIGMGPIELHPHSVRALARVIAEEMMAAVGAGNYAAGQRANMLTRAG